MNYRVHAWWNRFSHNWKLIASYVFGTKPPTFNPVGAYTLEQARKLGLTVDRKAVGLDDFTTEVSPEARVTMFAIPADYCVSRRDNEDPSILDVIGLSRSLRPRVYEAAGPVADPQPRVEKEQSNDVPDQAGSSPSHPRGD
jgi:hypothetical protein